MNPTARRAPAASAARLRAGWARLQARERRLLALAAAVVALALLWLLAVAPALRTLRQAEAQRSTLAAEAQRLQQLRREAEALKALPRLGHAEALRALEAAVQQRLPGSAQLSVVGDRATVVLKQARRRAGAMAGRRARQRPRQHGRGAPDARRGRRPGRAGAVERHAVAQPAAAMSAAAARLRRLRPAAARRPAPAGR